MSASEEFEWTAKPDGETAKGTRTCRSPGLCFIDLHITPMYRKAFIKIAILHCLRLAAPYHQVILGRADVARRGLTCCRSDRHRRLGRSLIRVRVREARKGGRWRVTSGGRRGVLVYLSWTRRHGGCGTEMTVEVEVERAAEIRERRWIDPNPASCRIGGGSIPAANQTLALLLPNINVRAPCF